MSVYTQVSQAELENFLKDYTTGTLTNFTGIGAGIENTNYFVTTSQGQYVLTLFEQMEAKEVRYYLDLMAFLAEKNIPCAHPLADRHGHYLKTLCQRPAALVQKLSGKHLDNPTATHCRHIGEALAQLHLAGMDYPSPKSNNRGQSWWHETLQAIRPKITDNLYHTLQNEIHFHAQQPPEHLPRGIIHADLFRDNALFDGDRVSGIIDFYYACHDNLVLDIAVIMNDWCTDSNSHPIPDKADALLSGYQKHRPLTEEEAEYWPAAVRAAALRFWLSRLYDMHFPRDGHITHTKDPAYFEKLLNYYQMHPSELTSLSTV